MTLRYLLASSFIGLMSTTSIASTMQLSEVDVSADLTVIENPQAAEFWSSLETDLEAAILALVADRIADDGARLVVNVEEFMIDDATGMDFSVDNAALTGRVHVIDLDNNANFDSFELTVSIQSMTATMEDGSEIVSEQMAPDMAYETLVAAFAENIVERLD